MPYTFCQAFHKHHTKRKGSFMDRSNRNELPMLFADTKSLLRQLEQRYQQVKSNTSQQAHQADAKQEAGMVIRAK